MTREEKRKLEKLIEIRLIDIITGLKTEDLQEASEVIVGAVKDLCSSEIAERQGN